MNQVEALARIQWLGQASLPNERCRGCGRGDGHQRE